MTLAPTRIRRRSSLARNWDIPFGEQRTGARVNIGGNGGRFEPLAYSEKWGREAWFTIAYPEPRRTSKPLFGGGLAELQTDSRKHAWYVTPDGELEYELTLHSRPLSPIIDFEIDFPKGLEFFYQPPLNEEHSDSRVAFATETDAWDATGRRLRHRPENVVGSYAVYIAKANNQYQTGKVAHIYRPHLTDAFGRQAWCKLDIDTDRKRLRITCPERWLANATYPVTLDPTLGYTSIGASTDDTEEFMLGTIFTAASSFDAATLFIGCSCDSGTQGVKGAGYSYDGSGNPGGEARLSGSVLITATTSMGFRSAAVTWAGITATTQYTLALCHQLGGNTAFDTSTGTVYWFDAGYGSEMAATCTALTGSFAGRISIYVESAAAGGRTTKNTRTNPLGVDIGMNWRGAA